MLEIKNVFVNYGKEEVLKGVSVSVSRGETVSIIGENGCGKSTLLKAALGIIPCQKEVLADGILLDNKKEKTAKHISYLAQGVLTPDMTVAELVLHGRFPHLSYPRRYTALDRELTKKAMADAGVLEYADRPLASLSGGMRQNAYIAMSLSQSTDYMLLDEPTTYLDVKHQLSLMRLIRRLADSGKGIVTVMHDLALAFNFSDRIIVIENGRVAADGTPEEISRADCIQRIFGVKIVNDGTEYRMRMGSR